MTRVDLDELTAALGMVAVRAPSGDQELVVVLYAIEQSIAELRAARAAVEALDEIRRLYLDLTAKGQHRFYVTRSYDVAMRGLADYRKAAGP